jgi:hypothetical protein
MDFAQLYDFLFNSYLGIAVLVGAGLVISILVCVILEVRTRKIYKNHERTDKDAWSIFEDDDDDENAAPVPAAAKQGGKKLNTKAVTGKTQTARAATVTPKKVVKKQAGAGAQADCASTDAGANDGAE